MLSAQSGSPLRCPQVNGPNREPYNYPEPDPIVMEFGKVVQWFQSDTSVHPL